MKSTLKQTRKNNGFTQEEAAKFLGVSLRSYKSYENDKDKKNTIKYNYMLDKLEKNLLIDEEHGILTIDKIDKIVEKIFREYNIEYCYLFGSYAKGKQKNNSDIDMLISGNVKGIKFYGLVEKLREALKKRIDLVDIKQLTNNQELLDEILRDGIKIYGQH